MRSLQTTDVFEAFRLVLKIGVREEVQEVAKRIEESKEKKSKMDLGFDLFFGILEKATQENAENEIYKFIANIFECTPEEVRVMKPTALFEQLMQAADIEEWKNFFGYVRRLITKK